MKQHRNAAIDEVMEEDYIKEENKDHQPDNESIDEIGFMTSKEKVDNKQPLACMIDGKCYTLFTKNIRF